MKHFTTEPMHQIIAIIKSELTHTPVHGIVSFEVLDPDCCLATYAGSIITYNDLSYIYRGYKAWTDLAQLLFCRMLTPLKQSEHTVTIRFQQLNKQDSFHTTEVEDFTEKYGVNSPFSKINKNEEPAFVYAYMRALNAVAISDRRTVLNLGINSGDEFELIKQVSHTFAKSSFTGIDYAASAIASATKRFSNNTNVTMITHDINHIEELELGRFELIISIGTLQSSRINFKPLFMSLIQNYLTSNGAVILGFPNSRWVDGEMIYGAKAPNYNDAEMSLVIKDIYFCKKYLQQHRFRVTITGKEYLFLTATRICKKP